MLVIKDGCVHNGRGKVERVDIAIDGGKIVQIGSNILSADADIINAAGLDVFRVL